MSIAKYAEHITRNERNVKNELYAFEVYQESANVGRLEKYFAHLVAIHTAPREQWATLRDTLSDSQLREIELEENENRKSLTAAERNKTFKAAAPEIETAQKAGKVSSHSDRKPEKNPKGGRPAKYGKPKPEVPEDLGISESTLQRSEQHVSLAELSLAAIRCVAAG